MRSFPSFRGQHNNTGWWWCATNRRHVGFESWLERDHVVRLDFAPDVVGLASQPFWLTWDDGRRGRRHAPDYFARLADGTGLVIDCRPAGRIKPVDAAAFAATERACAEIGWRYELAHEPDPVRAANLRWLAGYRRARCRRADVAAAALEAVAVPHRLLELARLLGDPLATLPVIFHLLQDADSFLREHEGSGTQRTYAYLLVNHLRWLERECLAFDTVVLRDLERYMGIVGAEVEMPLGEPWRVGKRPYSRSALSATAACLKGFYLHQATSGVNSELGQKLDAARLPTRADRRRAFLGHVKTTMPANPLAPKGPRRRHPKMLPEGARDKLLAEVNSTRDRLVVTWLADGGIFSAGPPCGGGRFLAFAQLRGRW